MEYIVLNFLNKTLDDLLHHRQHGFRRGLSCETQLCVTYHHDLVKTADEGHTTHAIVMDFKEAFDTVSHLLLLQKLLRIPEINAHLINWIHDFLSDRRQSVSTQTQEFSQMHSNVTGPIGIDTRSNSVPLPHKRSTRLSICNVCLYAVCWWHTALWNCGPPIGCCKVPK